MAAKKPSQETKTYLVVSELTHDNEPYEVGSDVELTAAQAEVLLALKIVVPKMESASPAPEA